MKMIQATYLAPLHAAPKMVTVSVQFYNLPNHHSSLVRCLLCSLKSEFLFDVSCFFWKSTHLIWKVFPLQYITLSLLLLLANNYIFPTGEALAPLLFFHVLLRTEREWYFMDTMHESKMTHVLRMQTNSFKSAYTRIFQKQIVHATNVLVVCLPVHMCSWYHHIT